MLRSTISATFWPFWCPLSFYITLHGKNYFELAYRFVKNTFHTFCICRILKPYLMDAEDLRGPWEYIWYHVVQAFGEDRKLLGVVGK